MKKNIGKILTVCLLALAGIAAILIGTFYFNFISQKIYEDSTSHLQEIYGQVNRSFGAFVERNWGLLQSWDKYFQRNNDSKGDVIRQFIEDEQEYWGFSQFYFLSENKVSMSLDGVWGEADLGDVREDLFTRKEPIMVGEKLSFGKDVTVFAMPATPGTYKDFEYQAIAVTYTNADMAKSLNVNAFGGQAKCFVIHDDGGVLFSTQVGGNVFANYYTYLEAASDLDEGSLGKIRKDWKAKRSGLVQCSIGDVSQCILYQPIAHQDYLLLSVVPQSAVSAGFLSVQKTTTNVLVVIFLLIGAAVIAFLLLRVREQSRRNRTELQYRERMFDVLSNSVDDIFMMLDTSDYHVDYISPNIERLLGIHDSEVRENIRVMEKCAVNFNVVIPRDELNAIPLNGNRYWECEYRHQTTGERRWYRMTVYHMSIQDVRKYIIVLSDRTLEQQMNQKLQEALTAARSANEAKSNFLSNMSHDIRTPMNAVVGFSMLLERDADNPEKVHEYVRKIKASSQHLLSLINDVLDMSKIESGNTSLNVERFELRELLDELEIMLAPQIKANGHEFHIHVMGDPPKYLLGDKLRLNQILINLLSNSIKYTPRGGKIDFEVKNLPGTAHSYARLQFLVRDNGIGMSREFLEQIFSPFSREINSSTNQIQGTGLGMAITKNLVDLMGGIIHVESELGQGSVFTVELSFMLPEQEGADPAVLSENPAELPVKEEPGEFSLEGRHFLVAEDNSLNAEILEEILGMEEASCDLATNGQEAVDMFRRAQPGTYDMILMDVQMPVMNGYDATRQIRKCDHPEAATIPIVAMTANTFAEDVKNAFEAGMNGHLAKPIELDSMHKVIGEILNREADQ